MWNTNLLSLTWNGQQLHHDNITLFLMEWMLLRWRFGSCSLSIYCSFNNKNSLGVQVWNVANGKEQDQDKNIFPRFDSFNFVSMFFLSLLNLYFVLTFYLCHNLYSVCVFLLPFMSVFVAPCRHKYMDYCIGSKFCKFYFIKTLFALLVIS